jgi:hypothetical protein
MDYKKLRKEAYPALEEQLDLIFHDIETSGGLHGSGSDEIPAGLWAALIGDIKKEYPKPEDTGE